MKAYPTLDHLTLVPENELEEDLLGKWFKLDACVSSGNFVVGGPFESITIWFASKEEMARNFNKFKPTLEGEPNAKPKR